VEAHNCFFLLFDDCFLACAFYCQNIPLFIRQTANASDWSARLGACPGIQASASANCKKAADLCDAMAMLSRENEASDGLEKYKAERARAFRKQLLSELFSSALPVFLGAVWSEAVTGCFEMMFKGDEFEDAKIAVRALLAWCIGAAAGPGN
jgi:hypothetical protein